jgi:preprotein translocase subunit YajC
MKNNAHPTASKSALPLSRISDRQWLLLLAGGFLFMFGGSWFSQFEPERRQRAEMTEMRLQLPSADDRAPERGIYAEVR